MGDLDFARALRQALRERHLPLNVVRDRLVEAGIPVAVSTLSYWQNGERVPRKRSLPTVVALERVLDLAPGKLTSLVLDEVRTPAQVSPAADIWRHGATFEQLVSDMRSSKWVSTRTICVFDQLTIDCAGGLARKRVLQTVTALTEVDRQLVLHEGESGCDAGLIGFEAVRGCRIGQVRRDGGTGLVVADLIFDHRLQPGESTTFEYVVTDENRLASTEYFRVFPRDAMFVLDVLFDPTKLPVFVETTSMSKPDGSDVKSSPLALQGNRGLVVREHSGIGVTGMQWEFA